MSINLEKPQKVIIITFLISDTLRFISSDAMSAYIGFEGYMTKSGFIHKELCIYYDEDEFDHYLFKKPEWNLSDRDIKTVQYATCQLNGLATKLNRY